MQWSDNIALQTAAQKGPQRLSYDKFPKDTKIAFFFWNSSKGGPRENRPKRSLNSQALKTPLRKSHRLLISMPLKCNHRTTFCHKPQLEKSSLVRAMANLAMKPISAIFWNSSKRGIRENRPKSRPNLQTLKTPLRIFYRLLISMRLKCNHRTTFCHKLRLQKCSQVRAMANLAKTPKSAIFWNSSKGGPRENRPKSRPNSQALKTPLPKFHCLLISMRLKCNHRTIFCHKPRLQKCSQVRAMANLAKTPKSAIFWNSSKGGPRENRPKTSAELGGSKNTSAQIPSFCNLYALIGQSSDNIVPQTAAPKVLASPSYGQFGKGNKIGHFLKFFKGGTNGKSPKKWAELAGSKNTSAQIPSSCH